MSESDLSPEPASNLPSQNFLQIVSNLPLELQQKVFYFVLQEPAAEIHSILKIADLRELTDVIIFVTSCPTLSIIMDEDETAIDIRFREWYFRYVRDYKNEKEMEKEMVERRDILMFQEYISIFGFDKLEIGGNSDVFTGTEYFQELVSKLIKQRPTSFIAYWDGWISKLKYDNNLDIFSGITSLKGAWFETFSSKFDWFSNLKRLELVLSVETPFTENDNRLIKIHKMSLRINNISIILKDSVSEVFNIHFRKFLIQHDGRIKIGQSSFDCIIDKSFLDIWKFVVSEGEFRFSGDLNSIDLTILPELTDVETCRLYSHDIISGLFESKSITFMYINCIGISRCDFSHMQNLEYLTLTEFGEFQLGALGTQIVLSSSIRSITCAVHFFEYLNFNTCPLLKSLVLVFYENYSKEMDKNMDWSNLPGGMESLDLLIQCEHIKRDIHVDLGDKFESLELLINMDTVLNDNIDFSTVPASFTETKASSCFISCSRNTKLHIISAGWDWSDRKVIFPDSLEPNVTLKKTTVKDYYPGWYSSGENI